MDSPQNGKDPVITRKLQGADLDDVSEYGYGFWLRFLAQYPVQLKTGLQAPWSFVARLTRNQDLGDIRIGDRLLAVWLNNGNFYHFTTNHQGNVNSVQNIPAKVDIEGVWTYLHFSHSHVTSQSIGYLKIDDNL